MYTLSQIEAEWLEGGRLCISDDQLLNAFNVVENHFGRDWIDATRTNGGSVASGIAPTLHIVALGEQLNVLARFADTEALLRKIRDNAPYAWAELLAIYLAAGGDTLANLELEPEILVADRLRVPDFRVRRDEPAWTYVEVSKPGASQDTLRIQRELETLVHLAIEGPPDEEFGVEVFLLRDVEDAELAIISGELRATANRASTGPKELPNGLGTIYWNLHPPGELKPEDHGAPYLPRTSLGARTMGAGGNRSAMVRWPFTDQRAEEALRKEAKQLPTAFPGLVMLEVESATAGMKAWRKLIERRFENGLHTRVSAACLFSSKFRMTSEECYEWLPETKLIINPNARLPLSPWIVGKLRSFESDEVDLG